MSRTSTIHTYCPTCKRVAKVKRGSIVGNVYVVTYECGHTFVQLRPASGREQFEKLKSHTGKTLYNFQIDGALFLETSGLRALLADEMGLGKTMQFLASMKGNPKAIPFLVLCKSSLKLQWLKEIIEWCGVDYCPQIVETSRERLYPKFKSYVMAMDLLRRFDRDALVDNLHEVGVKTICIDECQHIKNSSAQRTGLVRTLCKEVEHVIALSGTPIKNNAAEYFPTLNILRPDVFPSKKDFEWEWVDTYHNGYSWKYGGIKRLGRFKELTKDFIIRREREEVMPDLPTVSRRFQFSDLGKEVEDAYHKAYSNFKQYYEVGQYGDSALTRHSNLIGYLSKLRQLTGIAKIEPTIEFVTEFLETTKRKMTIFVHHRAVGVALKERFKRILEDLKEQPPLALTSDMNAEARNDTVEKFMSGSHRLLIASTLAAGEGLNLQACSDCIIMERQWNPANEEQAECRFIRIGQRADSVFATYMIAVGTIDEFFSELVEKKREIFQLTMTKDSEAVMKWNESQLVSDLSAILAEKGGRKWGW